MVNKEIAKRLREKGSEACIQKAEMLENNPSEMRNLSLRNLGLDEKDIAELMTILEQENDTAFLRSISFSYNTLIGDVGATLLAKKLPYSTSEIGLVGCGIGDEGGAEVLNWMRKAQNLQMI